ncbi:16S rRNA (uracil(1498)-N(3))-methyltransferase [Alkalicella caledoniensis]|uniref:Ribosomal RNA small subunit methyltransferase E n=1 Tax=Alkalicella caledoniensis TaxID=2731377 RepID=A0A7G9W4F5_ALKCA|nr:16S rRNA (uracil(1498)-N(3))-methyltransferase [Alkalicella caledoniensis]QNO13567.1 16S rRNA (uracil(1498)-N(3))-methyltransferase [Alkalicella caledoniensis]
MFRLSVDQDLSLGCQLTITGEEHHYITKVLRLKEDDQIIVFNQTEEYISSVSSQSKKDLVLRVEKQLQNTSEPKAQVVLAFGYLKGEKMDWVIQKATELGVTELWPVITKRSIVKIVSEKKNDKKVERFFKIAKEATEQSGRLKIPKIHIFNSLKEFAQKIEQNDTLLIPWEKETSKTIPRDILADTKGRIIIFIGPEGGLDKEEIDFLKNGHPITLGKRILRAETACIAATTTVMYILGELGGV